jgi:hypothetical protein
VTLRAFAGSDAAACRVSVALNSGGGENALGFSIGFDPEVYGYRLARLAQQASDATLLVNSHYADIGRIAVSLALPPARAFNGGVKELIEIEFAPVTADARQIVVNFHNVPLQLEVIDADAQALPANWIDGATTDAGGDSWQRSALSLRIDGGAVTISWPVELSGGVLETSSSLGPKAIWAPVTNLPVARSGVSSVNVEAASATRFYRLRQQ